MKEKILSIVPEAILEEKHGIWFVSVPRTSFHDLALRLRNDEDTSFDFLVCMTGMDWGETLGVMYHLRSSKYGHDLALRVETENRENPELPSVSDIWATANLNEREVFDFYGIRFINHPDMRRLFLRNDWIGYPLRKDYDADEAQMLPFSEHNEEGAKAYCDGDTLVFNAAEGTDFEMPVDELALNGLHNLYNSMAAGLSASLLNIKKDVIRKALSDFQSVEHRLEYVDTINGIRYVNDSKATNVNSCWYALESMKTPVVLILGGKDKGNDYSEIEKFVTDKVSAIVCMGKDNEKIKTFFAGKVPVIADTHSIGDAVSEATRLAKSGDTVLLSPCCASFDLFKSYEDRGRQFKDEVRKLKK